MLILTDYIARHELERLEKHITISDILKGAEKVLKGLAVEIKAPAPDFRFFKVRIGRHNAGRMVVFLVTASQKLVPLLIRLKKDKIFGMNMAMNNPAVVRQIDLNLERVLEDIKKKKVKEFPLRNT